MPAFNADAVTDKNIADIAAYLATLPPAVFAVASTAPVVDAAIPAGAAFGDPIHGYQIYAANCAACHGASAQGGVGPDLHGEKTRKDTAAAIAWIKHPKLPMPTLYPNPLSEKDVDDVAAYVESL
jgi:mono/diheme cytochrome c family protein